MPDRLFFNLNDVASEEDMVDVKKILGDFVYESAQAQSIRDIEEFYEWLVEPRWIEDISATVKSRLLKNNVDKRKILWIMRMYGLLEYQYSS